MTRIARAFCPLFLAGVAYCQAPSQSNGCPGLQHVPVTVKLLSPISSKTSHQGDTFTTVVETPQNLQGAAVSGKITKVKAPERGLGKGKPEVAFHFESMTIGTRTCPITADLQSVANSRGVASVDEEGEAIGKTSNKKRVGAALAMGALGAAIGAAAGGAQGAAAGGAAGAAAGFLIALKMTATGSNLEFYPGSHFTLDVSDRER